MPQYINKDNVIAEIERLQDAIRATAIDDRISKEQAEAYKVCVKLRSFVEDTIEVKEANLKKELERLDSFFYDLNGAAIKGTTRYLTIEDVKNIARYFFELGIKTKID